MIKKVSNFINEKKFREISHGSLYSFIAKVLVSVIGIIITVFSARYYGVKMMGLLAIIISILEIAGLFAMFGLQTSMLKLIPHQLHNEKSNAAYKLFIKILLLVLGISVIVSLILAVSSNTIALRIFNNNELSFLLLISSVVIIFQSTSTINITMLRLLKRIKLFALMELLPKVLTLGLLIVVTFFAFNKYNLIYVYFIVPVIVALISGFVVFKISKSEFNSSKIYNEIPQSKEILKLSLPMFLTAGMQLVIGHTDTLMLGVLKPINQVGVYSIVFTLSMVVNLVLSSINVMVAPSISRLHYLKKDNELRQTVQYTSKLMFWMSLPILLLLVLLGHFILKLYGDDFVVGYMALVFLVIGQFFNAISGSTLFILNMTGSHIVVRNIMLFSALFNIVLNYILIPQFGINGAAFSSMITVILWNSLAIMFIKKKLNFYSFCKPF